MDLRDKFKQNMEIKFIKHFQIFSIIYHLHMLLIRELWFVMAAYFQRMVLN
jgi:hypothetical protein